MKKLTTPFLALLLTLALAHVSIAGDDKAEQADDVKDANEHLTEATTTLKEVLAIPENGIPQKMLNNAAAVVVIPDLLKAGFIAGVKSGDGVISARNAGGWSLPAFVNLDGGSIGWQIGVESTDLVLVFMDEKHVKDLLNGEFTLGGDASVAIGPVGRQGSAGTNDDFNSAVYAYSRSKGAFAGISIDGSKIRIDQDENALMYGAGTTANDVLYTQKHAKAPQGAEDFKTTLNSLTKSKS
jgi:lipid-binding SYLF domain-containing protein